jgi:hypothetical protein
MQANIPEALSHTPVSRAATGVSIDASGKRFIWVQGEGLQEVTPQGNELLLSLASVDINIRLLSQDFEDVAVLDDNRIALIARNEGSIIDRHSGQQLSSFCYLPGWVQQEDPTAWQLSRALAFDASEDRLYVQPQTFQGQSTLSSSQIGLFDPAISEPLEWQTLPERSFVAGGMTVVSRADVYLGMGTRLYRYDARTSQFETSWELGSVLRSIDGLAYDPVKKTLVALDAVTGELVELSMNGL